MVTKALQVTGINEIKQVEIELPEIGDYELLMEVVVNVPKQIDREKAKEAGYVPYIAGCEFGGKVIGIGKGLEGQYKIRERIAVFLSDEDRRDPAFRYIGGCSQYVVIPEAYIKAGKVVAYDHNAFYYGALAIPTAGALVEGRRSEIAGSCGYSLDDIKSAVSYAAAGMIEPAVFVSHIGGIDAEAEEILKGENGFGQKLFYSHLSFPLIAIRDLKLSENPLMKALSEICEEHNGLWSPEAEVYLLNHAARI